MVSFRKIMNKVAPKLAAINQFGRNLERARVGAQKKVKFDLATVSFQVNYDTADYRCHHHSHHSGHAHHSHRHHRCAPYPHPPEPRIPLWRAHLNPPPNKSNICWHIVQQLTCVQWLKLIFVLFCLVQAIIQCTQLYSLYRKNFTTSSVNYRLPPEIEFPAITLCLPVIIPFQEQSQKCVKNLDIDVEVETEEPPLESHSTSPECENSIPISSLFNQSMSEYGHQCRVRYKKAGSAAPVGSVLGFKSSNCATISPPIESYFRNKRCFTYLSEITVFRNPIQDGAESNSILDHKDIYISLLIQSNRVPIGASTSATGSESDQPLLPELFIHASDKIPIDSIRSPVKLELNHKYKIKYYYLKTYNPINQWTFFGCHNYSSLRADDIEESRKSKNPLDKILSRQDCVDRCILKEQQKIREQHNCPKQEDCISHQIPIRRDLVRLNQDKICFTTPEDCPSGDEESLIQSILDQCDKDCPDDCESVDVQHETVEDSTETDTTDNTIQVTMHRKITPDIEVKHFPLIDDKKLLGDLGGLMAFWFVIIWIVFQTASLLEYGWELVQLYYL